MPSERPTSTTHPRTEYLHLKGLGLFTDVNIQILDDIAHKPIERLDDHDIYPYTLSTETAPGLNNSNLALYHVLNKFTKQVPYRTGRSKAFDDQYGISQQDKQSTTRIGLLESGFGDMTFSWQFAGGLANATVQSFVEDGKITPEQAAQLTLSDWANVIGSGWFAALAHSFAFTDTNVLKQFGGKANDFADSAFKKYLAGSLGQEVLDPEFKLFMVEERLEPQDNTMYLAASIHPRLKGILRARLRNSPGSIGCPVARKSIVDSAEAAQSDPHIQKLIGLVRMTVASVDDNTEAAVYKQEYTAIDRTLIFIGHQLDSYIALYGTPVLDQDTESKDVKLTHQSLSPINILQRPNN
jgi:hypothetical protein